MGYTVQTLLNDLASVTHGTTTNKIPNISGSINRAARAVLLDVDPKEMTRIGQLSQVFNSVFDYPIPADVKGDRIIDLRPQAGRTPADIFVQDYAQTFDANKLMGLSNAIQTQWNTGVKTIRIEAPTLTAPIPLTDTSTLTGWAATTGAASLTLDSVNNVAGGGALQFNLNAGSSSGFVETSTLSPVDLTAHLNISTLFLWVYLPTGASVTGIDLRWGSDTTTNFYNVTVTATQQGTAFQNGWNLLAFPWLGAAITGTPVVSALKYVRVTFNYNSTLQTGVKVDYLTSNLGYIFELEYYSKYIFRDSSTNAFQETIDITNGTDTAKLINLDTDSYNLLFNKTAYYVAQQLQGADADYDANFFGGQDGQGGEYGNALKRYRALNPSEAMKKAETYYSMPKKGYGGFNRQWPH